MDFWRDIGLSKEIIYRIIYYLIFYTLFIHNVKYYQLHIYHLR